MSYLDSPRLIFSGFFQADVSTINNDVTMFDNATFSDVFQQLNYEGSWNPEGTGIFRLVNCQITGAQLAGKQMTSASDDPVIGMALQNADDRVFGKLVDLDPQQQACSEIWGMGLRLTDGAGSTFFSGDYATAAFINLWLRQQQATAPNDQQLAAVYQSVLDRVQWSGTPSSAVLKALQQASEGGQLSINMNVYAYGRDPSIARYTLGRVAGVIGPYRSGEPKHFVLGRQMVAAMQSNGVSAANGVFTFQAKVDAGRKVLTADFGNSLQIVNANGAFVNVGPLLMAVLKEQTDQVLTTVSADQIALLGTVGYQQPDWYKQTAGVQEFDYAANSWCVANIEKFPLLLLSPQANNSYKVLVQESLGGLYVRADTYVYRLDPKQSKTVDLYTTQYGKPISAAISFAPNNNMIGNAGPANVEVPDIGTPADGVTYASSMTTDANGKATLKLTAGVMNPATPRGYIAGQVYGVGYQLTQQPAQTIMNAWNFISVLVFSPVDRPAQPTWYRDIQPILQQYANLYPIMSKHLVRLGDYDSVVKHIDILKLAFSLPIGDPNHMPVTRDLSAADCAMILQWMTSPGQDGLPLKGEPATAAVPPPPMATQPTAELTLEPIQQRGKMAVILGLAARAKAKERS
jgi:hypothetical protein